MESARERLHEAVRAAHRAGASYTLLGKMMGISRQEARLSGPAVPAVPSQRNRVPWGPTPASVLRRCRLTGASPGLYCAECQEHEPDSCE